VEFAAMSAWSESGYAPTIAGAKEAGVEAA
jgi:hypothetical protein